ncbi:MAG: sugar ABC transporter substrate-binding protein [Bacillota bacterium]
MNKKLRLIQQTFFVILITSISLYGCFSKPQQKPEIKPKMKIGLVLAEGTSEKSKQLIEQFEEEAKKEKVKLLVSDSKKNPSSQRAAIEKMVKEKVKGVILQPVDTILVKDYIMMLQADNIKTLIIDALPPDISVDGFIASDYLRAGELQSQSLLKAGNPLDLLILKGDKTNNITEKIYQGNLNILRNNTLVNSLTVKEAPFWNEEIAYQTLSETVLNQQINSVIVHEETTGIGVYRFLKDNELLGKVKLSTIDIDKDFLNEILKGNVLVVDTIPHLTSQLAHKALLDLIENNSWEYDLQINNISALIPAKLTPVRIIDKENIYLLEDRFKEAEKLTEQPSANNQKESNSSKNKENQTKLKIKTKDGKEYEVTIPGEVQGVEMEGDKKQ